MRGFFMGAADIVPGVSGGTIALALGIYRRLVASIRAGSSAIGETIRGHRSEAVAWLRKVEWALVLPLAAGIGLAVVTLSHVLESRLEESPVQMAALFLGLVAGSTTIAWRLLIAPDWRVLTLIAASTVVTFALLGVRETTTAETVAQANSAALPVFFVSGAIAICAMILPGISGSFLLVIMGMYGPVLGAVTDRDVVTLAVFTAGAVVGLALFSQILHLALERAHDLVMAALIGLMIGSIRVLWPWPEGVESTLIQSPSEHVAISVVLALAGFAVVIALSAFSFATLRREESLVPDPAG